MSYSQCGNLNGPAFERSYRIWGIHMSLPNCSKKVRYRFTHSMQNRIKTIYSVGLFYIYLVKSHDIDNNDVELFIYLGIIEGEE